MFGFETVEIVGGVVGLILLGLVVWKLSGSEEASDSSESTKSGRTKGRSDGKSRGKKTRS